MRGGEWEERKGMDKKKKKINKYNIWILNIRVWGDNGETDQEDISLWVR
jgi:hypothetical protein